jgi:hemoglobin
VDVRRRRRAIPLHAHESGKNAARARRAHRDLKISPDEFDEVAAELGRTLDFVKVPLREKEQVLAAFAAHKNEVTAGYVAAVEPRELIPT